MCRRDLGFLMTVDEGETQEDLPIQRESADVALGENPFSSFMRKSSRNKN